MAEREAQDGHGDLADRYVVLARRIGMRYNVRLPPEYRELYCRGCSGFWVEGRTVRTRLRAGRRVRVCLRCGRVRRVVLGVARAGSTCGVEGGPAAAARDEGALTGPLGAEDDAPDPGDETEEG